VKNRLDLQAKLLRAIQEGEIERIGSPRPIKATFRLVAATNVDLEKAVKEGKFRDDLYYRINVIPVKLPPLRERIEDLPELAVFFLRRYCTKFRKQVPMGSYFADFCSHSTKLIVEADGGQHAENAAYDAQRTRFLKDEGYKVLRFWNNEILENIDGVIARIAPHIPSPPVGVLARSGSKSRPAAFLNHAGGMVDSERAKTGSPKGRMRGSRKR